MKSPKDVLTREEWELMSGCGPETALWSRSSFEECVSRLLKKNPSPELAEVLYRVRKKLGFELVPGFLPLYSTKDLDLYQPVSILMGGKEYRALLWKREKEGLSFMLFDKTPVEITPGSTLEFQILREDDGRYRFSQTVREVSEEHGNVVITVPCTERLRRVDLRESPRWKASIDAKCEFTGGKVLDGLITDISTRGLRVCFHGVFDVLPGACLRVRFSLGSYSMNLPSTVRNVYITREQTCAGLQFDEISDRDEEMIRRWSYALIK